MLIMTFINSEYDKKIIQTKLKKLVSDAIKLFNF